MLSQKIFEKKKDALRRILVHSKLRCEKLKGLSPPAFKSGGGQLPPPLPPLLLPLCPRLKFKNAPYNIAVDFVEVDLMGVDLMGS